MTEINVREMKANLKVICTAVAIWICAAVVALGADKPAAGANSKPAPAAAGAAAAPAVNSVEQLRAAMAAIPKSTFAIPATVKEGRNPFFPPSKPVAPAEPQKEQPLDVSTFVLNGITGPPLRSAMINGHTFLLGEEAELRLQSGEKVLVKCEEIRDESAVIVVGGVRRELRLRFGI